MLAQARGALPGLEVLPTPVVHESVVHLDGRTLTAPRTFDADVVVVGSGPAKISLRRCDNE